MKKVSKKIYIIIALIILFVPLFLMPFFIKKNEADILEFDKRYPVSVSDVINSADKKTTFEDWFSDHLSFRKEMVSSWATLNIKIGVSCRDNYVVAGKKGWLFLGNIHGNKIDQFRRTLVFSEEEVEQSSLNLKKLNEYLNSEDLPFIFTIAPNKETIYPEFMPNWATKDNNPKYSELLEKSASKNGIDNIILNLIPVIESEKEEFTDDLYYKSDGHWSTLGAYFGYKAMVENLNKVYSKDYATVELISYTVSGMDGYELQKSLGIAGGYNDFQTDVISTPSKKVDKVFLTEDTTWQGLSIFENEEALNDSSILIIGDSFSKAYMQYFANTFSKTYFVHHRKGLSEIENIEQFIDILDITSPDVVVFELIERHLPHYLHILPEEYPASNK